MSRDNLGHAALVASANIKPRQWTATVAGRFNQRPAIFKITARDEAQAQRIAESMILRGESVTLEQLS